MSPSLFQPTAIFACPPGVPFSPLILSDRLISLAQEADRAGYRASADRLIALAYAVLDDEAQSCNAEAA